MYRRLLYLVFSVPFLALLLPTAAPADTTAKTPVPAKYRQWIEQMKKSPKGPFDRVVWFCNDGTIQPAKAYACSQRGGGVQHGKLNAEAEELRKAGYRIAYLLAGKDPAELTAEPGFLDTYRQLLIEKFLIAADDGWILRKALYYRGAIQEEDERAAARALLLHLIAKPEWIGLHYPALRIGARLLPHGKETASVQTVRQWSAALSDRDPGFTKLRVKIHGAPDAGDAQRVRDYAAGVTDPELKTKYEELAAEIDGIYQAAPLPELLEQTAKPFTLAPWLQKLLRQGAKDLEQDPSPSSQYRVTARLLAELRDALARIRQPSSRLRVVDLSLVVEGVNFRAASQLREQLPKADRHQRIEWLAAGADASYGSGLINARERQSLLASLARLEADKVPLDTYLKELSYLSRVPGWASQNLRFEFFEAMQKLAEIEPVANHFIQDQLRGSPLFFYSHVLDSLRRDGNQLAGVHYKLFGKTIGVGFNALNPGLARGVLHAHPDLTRLESFDPHGIYVLPETISDLPPVAGILTAGSGNPLSHIQLLARNLGIPNVSVDQDLIPQLAAHDGERVVLAVSPFGLVELAQDGPRWDKVFGAAGKQQQDVVIRPDLKKLDLSVASFLQLATLRASDSGRTVGPKAAKLGELHHHFPEAVAPGVAIPFGVFKQAVLDQPYKDTGKTVFQWMVEQYDRMQAMPEGPERKAFTGAFRSELYDLIANTRLDRKFQTGLRAAMDKAFGSSEGYGVFVRSDTNVEDLAGFTGAGLNLTLPNVVGFDQVLEAIPLVWASPFTARAFAWRQSHMKDPEYVYPAVLLLQSVPNDKSGVMVTTDLETGDPNILSVAVNEGVGGAVDGQAAESLRIDIRDGSVRLLASATAPWRRVPSPTGGVDKLPTSGSEAVLQPQEIGQLIAFAKQLPKRFPPITDDQGNPAPADVEFGFLDGKLKLFQLRPFLGSRKAKSTAYLHRMDQALGSTVGKTVDMNAVPHK